MEQNTVEKDIEEDAQKAAAEVQLQKYGVFLEEFSHNLNELKTLLPHKLDFLRKDRINVVHFQSGEQTDETSLELINSENKIIDKVLTVFCTLCNEVSFLDYEIKIKYLDAILYYGEGISDTASNEDCQLLISKTLFLLQNLSNLVKHCERVVLDLLSQLSAFYMLHFEITDANLFNVFDALADLLLILIMLEETLSNNNTLIYHWSLYRRTIQLALQNTGEFSRDTNKLYQLKKLVTRLETQLLSKRIFENVLNANFEKKLPLKKNKRLEDEFASYLKSLYNELDKTMNKENCTNMKKLTKLCAVFVLYVNIFGAYDKKFLKNISEILKKCPLVTLRYNVLIQLDAFVLRYIGSLLKISGKKLFEKDQQQYPSICLSEVTQQMNKNVTYYTARILSWILQLEVIFRTETNFIIKTDYLETVYSLLLEGIQFCVQIKGLLTTVSNLHMNADKPMYKNSAISFCRFVELIKCVDLTYARHHSSISKLLNYIVQYMEYQCRSILHNIQKNVTSKDKRFNDIRVDAMSSLVIAEHCLTGSPTLLRLTVATICLNLATQAKCFNDSNCQKLYQFLKKLTIVSLLHQKLHDVTECKFMYWNKSALPSYLEDVIKKKLPINRIQYMLSALEESAQHVYLNMNTSFQQADLFYDRFACAADITNILVDHVVQPTKRKMEENLRLHALLYLQLGKKTLQYCNDDLHNFQQIEQLRFNDKRFDLKFQVETYLDRIFYDLTTVALHDWQIYGEMRTLAKYKFQLNVTTDDGLPNHTLEQGPDLLEIIRDVRAFVANHFYNLNNQIFVEASSNNKHLNVVNIKHTANSIRTHGAGIMSTAVNYTYQFLCSKLKIFSQFLYDEQIKSRVLKDIAYFKEQSNVKFSFERAERFHRSMIKLGITGDGWTCLDQFRILISHIGNALGYVRLIRSGGLRYFSNAIAFVPNLKQIVDFENLSSIEKFSEPCRQAAINLNNVVNSMCHNMSEGTNYFKLLVDVFSSIIEDPNNDHLRNFYAVIPALTINFVEYMITAKEGLLKKNNKIKVTFTDDGFAMGVAYLLHTLKLYEDFDSLQWFQSVNERNEASRANLIKQIANIPKEDLKLNHTLNLSLKRLDVYQQEFNQLFYNLYSAQILFQDHTKPKDNSE